MTKKELRDILGNLFTTRGAEARRDGKTDRELLDDETIIYRTGAFDKTNEMRAVYDIVSGYAHESGLSHGFSYEIMSRAVDVLASNDDWRNGDAITESIDGAVPVYTSDLMQVYTSDAWAVDEAREEFGVQDSTKDAQMAWYKLIDDAVNGIKDELEALLDEDSELAPV